LDKLLTKNDLAERWQISLSTVDSYIRDGVIVPVKGIKTIRFNPRYIEEIEGTIPEPITWIEIRLQKENELLKEELFKLQKTISEIMNKCISINV
jgi:predicted site-specific integrase-resolvase